MNSDLPQTSSPMKFPSSSVDAQSQNENTNPNISSSRQPRLQSRLGSDLSSPLHFPTSSPLDAGGALFSQGSGGQQPPASTPRRALGRNDISYSSSQAPQQPFAVNDDATDAADPGASRVFIWGTTVDTNQSARVFRDFLLHFTPAHRRRYEAGLGNVSFDFGTLDEQDSQPYYPRLLDQRRHDESAILNLDCVNLKAYEPSTSLYDQLVRYPHEVLLYVMDTVVTQVFEELSRQNIERPYEPCVFKVRPFNLQSSVNLRDLNPEDIDKLVCVKGFVVRVSDVIPEMKTGLFAIIDGANCKAYFKCEECGYGKYVDVIDSKVTEPDICDRPDCGRGTFQIVHSRCLFYDKQIIRIQETPDSVPDGQTPHTVSLVAYDELVDCCKPGDRIESTGIYKAMPIRINPRMRATRAIFKTYIDILHVSSTERKRIGQTVVGALERDERSIEQQLGEHMQINPETERKIQEIAAMPDVYEKLAKSLAPSIFENEDTKKAVLLQIFGGNSKTLAQSESTKYRGNIHVLLVGDPATSKSQILQYVHRLSPRGIYTSGKGSSAVGLTAYVTRDPESKMLVLESGALVLSDGGICCIDEFDKMTDGVRSVLHEVMEQQTVSVAKAGIICTLNARASILAAANPIHSKWNPKLAMVQNVNLPPTLLSRFDLICIMLDQPDETRDTMLARHITSLYLDDREIRRNNDIVDVETFAAYISYARQNIHPRISDDCVDLIASKYVELRMIGMNSKVISATTRQLEAIIRLSEAHAKMRLSDTVETSDVDEAVRLINELMRLAALDPVTGLLDLDLLNTGISARQRQEAVSLKHLVRDKLLAMLDSAARGEGILRSDLLQACREERGTKGLVDGEFYHALNELLEEDTRLLLRNQMITMERSR